MDAMVIGIQPASTITWTYAKNINSPGNVHIVGGVSRQKFASSSRSYPANLAPKYQCNCKEKENHGSPHKYGLLGETLGSRTPQQDTHTRAHTHAQTKNPLTYDLGCGNRQ